MISGEHTVVIERPVEDVFAFVADQANEPKWHTDVVEVVRPEPGESLRLGSEVVWIVDYMGRNRYTSKVTAFDAGRRIEITGTDGPMKPTLTHRFEPAPGGTRYTRHVDIPAEGMFRLLEPLLRAAGVARKRQVRFAENLKGLLEG